MRMVLGTVAPDVPAVVASSPTDIRNVVSGTDLANVIHAYTQSVRWGYICAIPVAGLAAACGCFIKNRPLGPPKQPKTAEDAEKGKLPEKEGHLEGQLRTSTADGPTRKDSQGTLDTMAEPSSDARKA